MTPGQARQIVYMHLRATGSVVYLAEQETGKRSIPDLIALDRRDGSITRYRVMVGKRQRANGGVYITPSRIGLHADALAVVDRETGEIAFRASEAPTGTNPSIVTPGPGRAERDHATGRFAGAVV